MYSTVRFAFFLILGLRFVFVRAVESESASGGEGVRFMFKRGVTRGGVEACLPTVGISLK